MNVRLNFDGKHTNSKYGSFVPGPVTLLNTSINRDCGDGSGSLNGRGAPVCEYSVQSGETLSVCDTAHELDLEMGMSVVRFNRNGSTLDYRDGKADFTVLWEQPKPQGCVKTYPPTCTEDEHCWICYILFVVLLLVISCGTYHTYHTHTHTYRDLMTGGFMATGADHLIILSDHIICSAGTSYHTRSRDQNLSRFMSRILLATCTISTWKIST
jgi:hypothetical protein